MKTIVMESRSKRLTVEVVFLLGSQERYLAEQALAGQEPVILSRNWPTWLPPVLGAICTLSGGLVLWALPTPVGLVVGATLIIIAVLSQFIAIRQRAPELQMPAPADRFQQRWKVLSTGLERRKNGAQLFIPWSAIHKVKRLDFATAVFTDNNEYHLLPNRAFFGFKQQTRFIKLIHAGMMQAKSTGRLPAQPEPELMQYADQGQIH